jgi:hypothetical protein
MMNAPLKSACFLCAGWLAILAGDIRAQEPDKKEETRLRVDLVDGSRIIGVTSNKSLTVNVDFAELTIPLERIRQLQKAEKAKTVRVELNNGDIITGTLQEEPLNLTTIFGPVKLSMQQVMSVDVVPGNLAAWLPSPRGLVFYYPFDDGESATNHTADKHHGKANAVKWLEKGLRDGSMDFDGQGRVIVSHHQDLCPQEFTVGLWIYPTAQSSSYQVVFGKTQPGSWYPGYGLVRYSGDARYLHFFVNNYSGSSVKAEVPFNKWSHIACTFDGTAIHIYLNGKLAESRDLKVQGLLPQGQPPITHTTTPLTFGGDGGDGSNYYGWQGRMDEVVFYNRALPAEDIRRLYDVVPRLLGGDLLVKP